MANNFFIHDQVFDIYLFVDIVLRFFTAIETDHKIIDNHRMIAKAYITRWFILDLFACFPFYLINPYLYWLKIIRLFRAYRLVQSLKDFMITILGSKDRASEWQKFSLAMSVLSFIISLGLIIHSIACVWIFILQIEPHPLSLLNNGEIGYHEWTDGSYWTFIDNTSVYIASIYWTVVTFATVGYGDITPLTDSEVVFTMFVQMQGIIFFTYLMGKVTSMVADYSRKYYAGTQEQSGMNSWLIRLGGTRTVKFIDPSINSSVEEHFKVLWKNQHGNLFLDSPYIRRLPYRLREKLLDFIFEDEITKFSSFFNSCDKHFMHKIISSMSPRHIIKKNTEVISSGNYSQEMYFIFKNKIVVIKDDQEILLLSENSYFGEDLLIFNNKSDYSYCLNYSSIDLLVISKEDYMNILKFFPLEEDRAHKRAYLRKKYLERVSFEMNNLRDCGASFGDKVQAVNDIKKEFFGANGCLSEAQEAELQEFRTEAKNSENKVVDLQIITDSLSGLTSKLSRIVERA